MKTKLVLFFFGALFFVNGCVNTNATLLSNQRHPAVHPDDVVIYISEDDIPGDYDKVALIYAKASANWTTESKMLKALRKQAAALGANGILYSSIQEPSSEAKVAAVVVGADTERRAEMIAILVYN